MAYTATTHAIGSAGLTTDLNAAYAEIQRLGAAVRFVYLSQSGILSDAVLSMGSTTLGSDQTVALQAILDRATAGPLYLVWDVACSHTGLRIRSNTNIVALPGCGAILLTGGVAPLFENYNLVINGPRADANISISGVGSIWNGNGLALDGTANRVKGNATQGLACALRFYGVENLSIRDIIILRPRTYAIHGLNIGRGLYQGVKVDVGPGAINMDGLHFDGNCNDCIIRDVDLTTFDDGVGCNADDAYLDVNYAGGVCGAYYTNAAGAAVRILFDNVRLRNSLFGVRLLSGGSRIDEVTIRGVSGTTAYYGLVIDNFRQLPGALTVNGPGNFGRVVVEDYSVMSSGAQTQAFITQLACVNVNAQIDTLIFRNTRRSDFTFNGFPTFRLTGTGTIRHLIFEGYESLDTGSMVTDHIIVDGPVIATLTLQAVNVDRTAGGNASGLLKILTGTVNTVQLANVNVNGLDSIINNTGGTLNYVHATNIRHTGAAAGAASFKSASAVQDIVVSNYFGPAQILPTGAATFLVQRGDGFGTTQSGGSLAPVAAVTAPGPTAVPVLNETFTDPALGGWTKFGPASTTGNSTATGKLSIAPAINAGLLYSGIILTYASGYNMTGRRFQVLLSQPLSAAYSSNDTLMALQSSADGTVAAAQVRWMVEGGQLLAQDKAATLFSVAYSAINHRYLGLRVAAGVLYYETSADGTTWTVATSRALTAVLATAFDATLARPVLSAGTNANSAVTGTAVFDLAKITAA